MTPALTVKGQVTIPKAIREFLGVGPGERLVFEPLPDGRVAIAGVNKTPKRTVHLDPIDALIGSATRKISTDELMRLTRGDDWNKP
ncbi:MAG: type II toxin-antitoxin system PrlF family antitoxin [Pseudomonadota bacterium]